MQTQLQSVVQQLTQARNSRHFFRFLSIVLVLALLFESLQIASAASANSTAYQADSTQLPALVTYSFTSAETKVLPGLSTKDVKKQGCTGTLEDKDTIGRLVIVSLPDNIGCWTDGRFNHNDFKVEQGQLVDSNGKEFEAYKVHPPAKIASKFPASPFAIYYQFPTKEDYTVYIFDGQVFKKVLEVAAAQIILDKYTALEKVTISDNKTPLTYVFTPSTQPLKAYAELAPGVEGAQLAQNAFGTLAKYRYTVAGTPFDTMLDYPFGPAKWENIYSQTRQFFPVQLATQVGVIWQDKLAQTLQLTKLSADLRSQQTVTLPNPRNEILAAATSDNQTTLYYLTLQKGGEKENSARTATLYKVDAQGKALLVQPLDTSPVPNGSSSQALDISKFEGYVADMRYANGLLGIMLGRRLHRREDGLQHQSGVALVYQADTLALLKNLGQTSGHSFENVLTTNQANQFVGIDLGDNFPRGVNLHKFDKDQLKNKVVYSFKTDHGGAKRSNDNRTYTELGGVIEGQQGYTVVFAGETSPDGKSMVNSRVGKELNDPRNIGLVQVKPDFEAQDDFVLTQGANEDGSYYDFLGQVRTQKNRGIVWLTNYQNKDQENISRLKAVKLPDGNLLLLWEKWTADTYVNTYAMKVTESGVKLTEPLELGAEVRLNRRDNPLVSGNQVYLVAGDKAEKKLLLIVLQTTSATTPTATPPAANAETLVSLQSANFPERFVRHSSFVGRIDPIASELDQKDSTFRLVSGLADNSGVSLEAVNSPGYFLVVEESDIVLRERKPNDAQFDKNATFIKQPGLSDPTLLSLESFAQPGSYVRHSGFVLYANAPGGDLAVFNADATFKQTAPNWMPTATVPTDTTTQSPAAPPAQPGQNAAPLKLEIGKEYVIREANNTYRYFKLTRQKGETYHFELCPYMMGSMDATGPTNVLSVEAALAQNITPTNESCTWGEQNRVLRPEVGKQYVILEANNTSRYFKVIRQRGDTYNFELCPDGRGTMSATRPTNVMRVDVALAQNITPTNQPCDTNKVPYGN